MARVTHVKRAQRRYKTVPVIDPSTGKPRRTPVMRRDGTQRTTKGGRLVYMAVTRQDKSAPLPNRTCDKCGVEIKVGDPYKHVTPKSSPYGGSKRVRCAACPTWQAWELSASLSARVAQIDSEFHDAFDGNTDPDDVRAALETAAESIKALAEEKREGAQNIEDGFGHPTSASEELTETADALEEWAEQIEGCDVPDPPDPDDVDCDECDGTGEIESDSEPGAKIPCDECEGSGHPSETTDDQWDEWREEIENDSGINECPV